LNAINYNNIAFIKVVKKGDFIFRYFPNQDELYICKNNNELVIKGIWGKMIQDVLLNRIDLKKIYKYFLNQYEFPKERFFDDINKLISILENNGLILLMNDRDLLRR